MRPWRVVVAGTPELARLQCRFLGEQRGFEVVCVTADPDTALEATRTLRPSWCSWTWSCPGAASSCCEGCARPALRSR